MSNSKLTPDQFLYARQGPWPQPSPSHPLEEAWEVLNIPPLENMLWNATIGQRYIMTQVGYPPKAAANAVKQLGYTVPDDVDFQTMMLDTSYIRYLKPLSKSDKDGWLTEADIDASSDQDLWKYDFSAMELVRPLEGMYCAATVVIFKGQPGSQLLPWVIRVNKVTVRPTDSAWGLAKIYALQGAAYHMLFVVHPALHFPMDSVNAVTKTAVPYTHPLFQLLIPHTSYTLALDNAVLESPLSVVNNNARGTWFDPLTGDAYNLKLLFGAGYTGLPEYADAYPPYDYLRPPLLKLDDSPADPVFDTAYSRWLTAYFQRAFLPFCKVVADNILTADPQDTYVKRWAQYLHTCVHGFPDEKEIFEPGKLALTLAIFMWDTSIAHGADHYSFAIEVPVVAKFLRIRRPPPTSASDAPVKPGEIFTGDDLYRAEMAQWMFFMPWTLPPNLNETYYAFTDPRLAMAQEQFHANLTAVSGDPKLKQFMPLVPTPLVPERKDLPPPYSLSIPASIQY
jgi:hypothetical protein